MKNINIDKILKEVEEKEKFNNDEAGREQNYYVDSLIHENREDFYVNRYEDNYLYYNKR